MNNEKIKTYDECNVDEKEILDSFRKMKLMYDHARFKLHALQVEDLIKDYGQLKKLREEMNEVSQEGLDILEYGELADVEIQKTVASLMETTI